MSSKLCVDFADLSKYRKVSVLVYFENSQFLIIKFNSH